MELEFRIIGVVRERETRRPLSGLMVRAYDKDLIYDDLLGAVSTDSSGCFEIRCGASDFQELFDRRPDLYFKILDGAGQRQLHSTRDAIRWNARPKEYVQIDIPREKLPPESKGADFVLTDADGRQRVDFEAGDSLMINVQGLRPDKAHQIRLVDDGDEEILSSSLLSNRFGVIAPTVLWPDMGIGVPEKGGKYAFETFEEALSVMAGKTFVIEVLEDKQVVRTGRITITKALSQKRLYSGSESGALRRGLLLGRDELRVHGRNFQADSLVDIYLVKRRLNWRAGDPIVPVRNQDGTEVTLTVKMAADVRNFQTLLWGRELLQPGSYDILAREVIPNEYLRHERVFRESDLISDRFISSLVIRDDIFHYKPIQQGCVMATKEIAGKMLWGVPEEILYTNNFPKGTDVWAALDPAGLMPAAVGKKVRYYVIAHKTPAQWGASSSLAALPGTGAEIITTSSCVNGNAALVWSNPQQAGKYDLVVDFGNNDPNPANFVADDSFDPPLDMIDGYLNVGFYVSDDPSIPGGFSVGQTSFNDPAVTIPATGVWAPWGTIGNTPSGTLSLPMVGEVRYPSATNGVNVPVSPAQANYPVVIIMHGMHSTADPSYLGYNYLLDHLASHGFIALSIDCNAINAINGMQDTRARAILAHLTLLQSRNTNPGLFQGKIDLTQIAIMGHSRGGDGVVQAEILNQSLALGWNIRAIVALAPTDFSGTSPAPLNLTTAKFLCVYGSNDGDVWGGANPSTQYTGTGFRFYDRASIEKATAFIYGATHNRFNTQWGTESKVDAASPKVLSLAQHQTLLRGYMTAFLQAHLQGRTEQLDYFSGELKIPQASAIDVYVQYQPTSHMTLDDYEAAPSLNQNTLGGNVTFANLDGSPQEDALGTVDPNSPHQSKGIRLKWNATTARYQSEIPLVGAMRNVSGRKFLSFRVTQKVESGANPLNQLQDLRVRLTTAGGGNSRAVRAGYFGSIPFPYKPEYTASFNPDEGPNTKAALATIRIPLYAWTIKCLSVPIVNLSDVESVAFEFDYRPTGEIEVDDLQFTD